MEAKMKSKASGGEIRRVIAIIILVVGGFLIARRIGSFVESQNVNTISNFEAIIDDLADNGFGSASSMHEQLLQARKVVIASNINAMLADRMVSSLLLLNELDPDTAIDMYIRTEGGWVDDAYAIIDVMNMISAPVNTHAIGGTHSAGAMILAAGTGIRTAYENSVIMFHAGLGEPDDEFGENQIKNKREILFWQSTARLPHDWVNQLEDRSYFLDAEQALQYEIVDKVVNYPKEKKADK